MNKRSGAVDVSVKLIKLTNELRRAAKITIVKSNVTSEKPNPL